VVFGAQKKKSEEKKHRTSDAPKTENSVFSYDVLRTTLIVVGLFRVQFDSLEGRG
jgi:hypothetical protein